MNLPFLKKTALQDGSMTYSSETIGLTIIDPDPSNTDALLTLKVPAFEGHDAVEMQLMRGRDVEVEYAHHWLRKVCIDVGLGFHIDTPADDYSPGLSKNLHNEYDEMIEFCRDHIDNPYAVVWDAMEKAGYIENTPRI